MDREREREIKEEMQNYYRICNAFTSTGIKLFVVAKMLYDPGATMLVYS